MSILYRIIELQHIELTDWITSTYAYEKHSSHNFALEILTAPEEFNQQPVSGISW